LWESLKEKTWNLTLKSWRSICITRHLGGLRIRNMFDIYLPCIDHKVWMTLLSNPDSFWIQRLHAKYIGFGTFLSSPYSQKLPGYGKEYSNAHLPLPQVHVSRSPWILISLFGLRLAGFSLMQDETGINMSLPKLTQ
jgi:hypothetical protein